MQVLFFAENNLKNIIKENHFIISVLCDITVFIKLENNIAVYITTYITGILLSITFIHSTLKAIKFDFKEKSLKHLQNNNCCFDIKSKREYSIVNCKEYSIP